jgi:O-antigen ligase
MIRHLPQDASEYRRRFGGWRGSALVPGLVAAALIALTLPDGAYAAGVLAAAAAACWWLVFVMLAVRLIPVAPPPRAALVAGGLLLGFVAFTALSMAWSEDDGAAYQAAILASLYLGVFALVVLGSRPASARQWLQGLALGLGAICVLALASHWFPGLEDDRIARSLPNDAERLSYPVEYWNALGGMMALLACLLGWLSFRARSVAGRSLATAALILPALALYLTSSRGGVVAAAAGLVVLVACARRWPQPLGSLLLAAPGCAAVVLLAKGQGDPDGSQGIVLLAAVLAAGGLTAAVRGALDRPLDELQFSRRTAWVAAAAVSALALAAAVAADPAERLDRFQELPKVDTSPSSYVAAHLGSDTGSGRYQFWEAAVDAFEEEPLAGIGAGGYESWWNRHASFPYSLRNAHSLFLETLAELGLIGLALIAGAFVACAAAGLRRLRGDDGNGEVSAALAVLAAGTVTAAIEWSWQIPAAFSSVIVAMAVLAGPATLERRRDPSAGAAPSGPARVAALAVTLLLAGAAALLALTEIELEKSRRDAREGDLTAAAGSARSAAALEPWASAPYLQLALVAERGGDFTSALEAIDEAIERNPEDWTVWLVRARLETRAGNVARGRAALARALELNPRSPVVRLLDQPG